jgi:hypothetical protein
MGLATLGRCIDARVLGELQRAEGIGAAVLVDAECAIGQDLGRHAVTIPVEVASSFSPSAVVHSVQRRRPKKGRSNHQ